MVHESVCFLMGGWGGVGEGGPNLELRKKEKGGKN
jgi:hypothetical protein